MYSPAKFLEHAKAYVKTKVSDQAVAELQEVSANPRRFAPPELTPQRTPNSDLDDRIIPGANSLFLEQSEYKRTERAVHEWLEELHEEVVSKKQLSGFYCRKRRFYSRI
jgi:hypothetical protein